MSRVTWLVNYSVRSNAIGDLGAVMIGRSPQPHCIYSIRSRYGTSRTHIYSHGPVLVALRIYRPP